MIHFIELYNKSPDPTVKEPRILKVESDFINMQDQSTSLPEEKGELRL